MAASEYVLKPRPPVRAYVTAAVASLTGALLLVLTSSLGWHPVVAFLGGFLLFLGVAVAIVAALDPQRQAVRVALTDEGYRLTGAQGEQGGTWADVTRVVQSDDGMVTIHRRPHARERLIFSSPEDPQIESLLADMVRRLDKAKGYRAFE